MKRKQFLNYSFFALTGTGILSLCIEACKKKEPISPAPAADFTIDLTDPLYAALKNTGGFVYKNDIIIAKTSVSAYIALSKACTHQGCTVSFDGINLPCPCHGAKFSASGSVIKGPASSPLTKYNTTLSGTTLRIFS